MESISAGGVFGYEGSRAADAGRVLPWQPLRSRADLRAEEAALMCVRGDRRDEGLKILMIAYGAPLVAFALRAVRDRELAKDVRQQVFLEAYQGIDKFEGRSTLWSWLCGIAYHRCLDELRRGRRTGPLDDFDVLDGLAGLPDPSMDEDRIAKRCALERCLGKLPTTMRAQLLMRCFLGLSYAEIAEVVGDPAGTVQVRISRILPPLRRCLRGEGVAR